MSIYESLKTGLKQAISGEIRKVDMVEVVRCKECIHYVHWLIDTDHIARFWCDYLEWNPKETDFCSRGYRKGESEDESECD